MKSCTAISSHSEQLCMASGKTKMLRTAVSVGDSGHDQILHAPSHSISSPTRSVIEVTLKAMKPFSLTLNFNYSFDAGVLCHCTLLLKADLSCHMSYHSSVVGVEFIVLGCGIH